VRGECESAVRCMRVARMLHAGTHVFAAQEAHKRRTRNTQEADEKHTNVPLWYCLGCSIVVYIFGMLCDDHIMLTSKHRRCSGEDAC